MQKNLISQISASFILTDVTTDLENCFTIEITHKSKMLLLLFASSLLTVSISDEGPSKTEKTFSVKREEIKREPVMELGDSSFDQVTRF